MNFPVREALNAVFNKNVTSDTFEEEFQYALASSNYTIDGDQITFKFARNDRNQEYIPVWREFIVKLFTSLDVVLASNEHGFSFEPTNAISYTYRAEHVFVSSEKKQIKFTGNTIYVLTIHKSILYQEQKQQ